MPELPVIDKGEDNQRIDKWLWSVRIFKTRSQASEACRKGNILMGDLPVKASRLIKPGDVVKVRKPPIYRVFRALEPLFTRVGAKETAKYVEEITPPEELARLQTRNEEAWIFRDPGSGRPTKKERRELDDFFNQ